MSLNESTVEDAALEWFGELGYAVGNGPRMVPGEAAAERRAFSEKVLGEQLRETIRRLNPGIPEEARRLSLRAGVLRPYPGILYRPWRRRSQKSMPC